MADRSKFLLFVSTLSLYALIASSISAEESRLAKYILNSTRYSPEVRPVEKYNDKVIVRHGLTLAHLIKLDEKSQIITTRVIIKMRWDDVRLAWDPALYKGITEFNVDVSLIWIPLVELFNNADDSLDTIAVPRAIVRYNGTVTAIFPRILKSTCKINVKDFPFDQQVCELRFGSFQFNVSHMDVLPLSMNVISRQGLTKFQENGEWLIGETKVVYGRVRHAFSQTHEFAEMSYKLVLRRKPLYYIVNFMIPCALIALITILLFLIPADTGEQMAVAITILLSMAVFFLLLEDKMPETSDHVPLIGKYFACTIVEISLAVGATCMMLCFHHHEATEVPVWMKKYILVKLATLLRIKTSENGLQTASRRGTVLGRLKKSNRSLRRTDNFAVEIGRSHLLIWQAKAKAKRLRRERAEREEQSCGTLLTNLSEDSPNRVLMSDANSNESDAKAALQKGGKDKSRKKEEKSGGRNGKEKKERSHKEKEVTNTKEKKFSNDAAVDVMMKNEEVEKKKKRRSKESRSDEKKEEASQEKVGHSEAKESRQNKEIDARKSKKTSKSKSENGNVDESRQKRRIDDENASEEKREEEKDGATKARVAKKERHEKRKEKAEKSDGKEDVVETTNTKQTEKEKKRKKDVEVKSKEDKKAEKDSKEKEESKSKDDAGNELGKTKEKERGKRKESKNEKKDTVKEELKQKKSSNNSKVGKGEKSEVEVQKDEARKEKVESKKNKTEETPPTKVGKWSKLSNDVREKKGNKEERTSVVKDTETDVTSNKVNRKEEQLVVNDIDEKEHDEVEVLELCEAGNPESGRNKDRNVVQKQKQEDEATKNGDNHLRQEIEIEAMQENDAEKVTREEVSTDVGSCGSIRSYDDDTRILIPSAKHPSTVVKRNAAKQFRLVDRVIRVTESLTQRMNKSKVSVKLEPAAPPQPTAKQLSAKKLGSAVNWAEAEHESVKLMAHTIQEKEADGELKTKWKEVGRVINNLLMWVYILSIFLTFFSLFGPVFVADEREIN